MKRLWKILLLTALLGVTATVWAWADGPDVAGIGINQYGNNVSVTATTTGTVASNVTIEGTAYTSFYPGAEYVNVVYSPGSASDGTYTLVLAIEAGASGMPQASNIVYINQGTVSDGKVEFSKSDCSLSF